MSKRTRTLVIAALSLVALVALLLVLLFVMPADSGGDSNETTATADAAVTLIDKHTEDGSVTVTGITVTAGDDSYSLVPDKNGDMTVVGFEDLPRGDSAIEALCDSLLSIEALRTIAQSPSDLVQYGLSPAVGSIAVTYSDKTAFTVDIGNLSPSKEGCYLRVQNSNTVYLAETALQETVTAPATDYLSTVLITAPSANQDEQSADDEVVVRDATFSGSVRPAPIEFHVAEESVTASPTGFADTTSGYVLEKPYYRGVDSESALIVPSTFSSITASGVAAVHPTAAELAAFGLNTPYSVCRVTLAMQRATTTGEGDDAITTYSFYNAFEYTLKLGNKHESGARYAVVYSEDVMTPIVYLVQADGVTWAEAQYDDIAEPLLFYLYIGDVQGLTLTGNGVTTDFALTHNEDETDGDKNMTVTAGGTVYNNDNFRNLYSSLMSIVRTGSATNVPTGTPELTLVLTPNTDRIRRQEIKLYRYSAAKYIAVHATGETHLVDAKTVESTLTKYADFLAGNTISAN